MDTTITPDMAAKVRDLMTTLGFGEGVVQDGAPPRWSVSDADVVSLSRHAIEAARASMFSTRAENPAVRNAAIANAEAVANCRGLPTMCPYPEDDPLCVVWLQAFVERAEKVLGAHQQSASSASLQ